MSRRCMVAACILAACTGSPHHQELPPTPGQHPGAPGRASSPEATAGVGQGKGQADPPARSGAAALSPSAASKVVGPPSAASKVAGPPSAASKVVGPPSAASRVAGPSPAAGPLAGFYRALRALEKGQRKDHVRILWLGDSHAQADFWTDAVRSGLQRRFGNAGPGFVHLGFKSYRHAEIRTEIEGRWRMRPKKPSTVTPWGDGAFGLGGIRHAGFAGFRSAAIKLVDTQLSSARMRWDLCYRFGDAKDAFRLQLGGGSAQNFRADGDAGLGRLQHAAFERVGLGELKVTIGAGRPDFCGVAIETDPSERAGVVLDNLGINGARYGTALAWQEQAWASEVRRRAPELFVFEYGGNEASDIPSAPKRYHEQARQLIRRARRILPEVSCLVVGPADRADVESKIPPIVAAMKTAALAEGCMFWNTYEVMGGRGSLRRWRADARAADDGIHLKPKGYAELGALMLADLMAGYQP